MLKQSDMNSKILKIVMLITVDIQTVFQTQSTSMFLNYQISSVQLVY